MSSTRTLKRTGDDDRRFVRERHSRLEQRLVRGREEGMLMDIEADAVTHSVAKVLAQSRLLSIGARQAAFTSTQ